MKTIKNITWRAFAMLSNKVSPTKNESDPILSNATTIGICTYVKRYEKYFQKLAPHISALFPESKILVVVNGYHNKEEQEIYLKRISEFCRPYRNVNLFICDKPTGLASIWNNIIGMSETQHTLILNDDVDVLPGFREDLRRIVRMNVGVSLIRASWSHFVISRALWQTIGRFDDAFPGVGNEDQDFEIRMALRGCIPEIVQSKNIRNLAEQTKEFSWANEVEVTHKKYTKVNEVYFNKKYKFFDEWRRESVYVRIMSKYCLPIQGEHSDICVGDNSGVRKPSACSSRVLD